MGIAVRTRALVELARPGNVIGAAILAFVGVYVAAEFARPFELSIAVMATALGTAAGNAINDYFDREIDMINRPNRPIPSGRLTPTTALWAAVVAFLIAVIVTIVFLPIAAIAIAAINLILLTTYTQFFKGTPGFGNLVVAFLVASAIWFGGAAGGALGATLVIGSLAGFATLSREIVKDIEDAPGDRARGLQTLPVVVGPTTAWYVALLALAAGAIISPIPYLDGTFDWWYFVGLIPAIAIMGYGAWLGRVDPSASQRFLKGGMYVALAAFILGRVHIPL